MNLYMVSVVPNPGVEQQHVQSIINGAADWYRFRAGCWIIASPEAPSVWAHRLQPLANLGHVIVVGVDPNVRWGMMNADFWKWLAKYERQAWQGGGR